MRYTLAWTLYALGCASIWLAESGRDKKEIPLRFEIFCPAYNWCMNTSINVQGSGKGPWSDIE